MTNSRSNLSALLLALSACCQDPNHVYDAQMADAQIIDAPTTL